MRAYPFLHAARQEGVEHGLVEQGVTVGEKEHVPLGMIHQEIEDRPLVDPRPDRLHRARRAQLFQRADATAFKCLPQRFLVPLPDPTPRPLTLIVNWPAMLERR